jgi:uncharacterized protein (DUF58 family)
VAQHDLNPLPDATELRSFARAAAHLLAQHPSPAPGARTVRRRAGVGLQHLDHRDYVPGDDVRHIDWQLTARRQRPILRQFEAETSGDWFLLLDASSSMVAAGAARWQGAVRATAAMAFALLELGNRVALVAFADEVVAECPIGRGASHFPTIARTLRGLHPSPRGARSNLAACARRIRGTASGFVISDFLGPGDLRPGLAALRERCVRLHALLVEDPTELRLAGDGLRELVDVESGATLSCEADPLSAEHASQAQAELRQRLRRFATLGGIAFDAWDVAVPWQRALIGHLAGARAT